MEEVERDGGGDCTSDPGPPTAQGAAQRDDRGKYQDHDGVVDLTTDHDQGGGRTDGGDGGERLTRSGRRRGILGHETIQPGSKAGVYGPNALLTPTPPDLTSSWLVSRSSRSCHHRPRAPRR